ncbi:MAG: diacylglyceryl transferase [Flavobacteriaceae bacterium]|nr:diacylglyceryl transferase [Flavobacteriaceae bacterium]MBL6681232.1 diacylglyceryl transferase [Flavobacteriaceae bacterium]
MEKLKSRFSIESNFQLFKIIIVFGITGTLALYLSGPVIDFFNITKDARLTYYLSRFLIVFPIYQTCLLVIAFIFGEFSFFWRFFKKMMKRFKFRN